MSWLQKDKISRYQKYPYNHHRVKNLSLEKPSIEFLIFGNHLEKDMTLGHPAARWGDLYIHDERFIRWGQKVSTFTDHYKSNPNDFSNRNESGSVTLGYSDNSGMLEVEGQAIFAKDGLSVGTDNYVNFGIITGSDGYGFRDNSGQLQVRDQAGDWRLIPEPVIIKEEGQIVTSYAKVLNFIGAGVTAESDSGEISIVVDSFVARRSVSESTTLSVSDSVLGVQTTAPITIILPLASALADGQTFVIKDELGGAETHPVTIQVTGGNTIDGESFVVLDSPYSAINFLAVLSPTPGNPGILSTASPFIPRKSITCLGSFTSNFSFTSSIPHVSYPPPNIGRYMKIFSLTSCAKSLSGVTINVLKPFFSAFLAKVPIMSSAS